MTRFLLAVSGLIAVAPALANDGAGLHLHAATLIAPILVAAACATLVLGAAPKRERIRIRVRAERRDRS